MQCRFVVVLFFNRLHAVNNNLVASCDRTLFARNNIAVRVASRASRSRRSVAYIIVHATWYMVPWYRRDRDAS